MPLADLIRNSAAVLSLRYLLGIACILLVVVLWVGAGFLTAHVYEAYSPKPFFVTYYNTAAFSLNFLVLAIKALLEPVLTRLRPTSTEFAPRGEAEVPGQEKDAAAGQTDGRTVLPSAAVPTTVADPENSGGCNACPSKKQAGNTLSAAAAAPPPATFRQTLVLAFQFCILWFAANWAGNAAYNYTTVSNFSILSSTSGFFTLLVGALFGTERFTWKKIFSVVICLGGVALVMTSSENGDQKSGILGDCLALLSALLYGFYATLVKKRMGVGESVSPSLFFGLVGILNIVMLWPGFAILHFAKVEHFDLPASSSFWKLITINAVLGTFLSDYAWLWAVLLTSPLVVTLGISLTIPVSMVAESAINNRTMSALYFLGAFLVIIGFVLVNLAAFFDNDKAGRAKKDEAATVHTDPDPKPVADVI